MVTRIQKLVVPPIVRMASEKTPELIEAQSPELVEALAPEGKAFYVVTGLLTCFMGVLAVIAVSAAVIVFTGGL